jgi:hypothetical protein
VPYDLLNKIRIHDVKLDQNGASVTAELTSAYEPGVGLERFTRKFVFTAPGEFDVEDSIKASRPQPITAFLHSDNAIKQVDRAFHFEPGTPLLLVHVLAPQDYNSVIEPNFLTAPGPPGSVDKGQREQRGVRLAISTKQPVIQAEFHMHMKITR